MDYNQMVAELEARFFLYTKDQPVVHQEFVVEQLLLQEEAKAFLHKYGKQIKALTPHPPATYFCSKLGIAAAGIVTMLARQHLLLPMTPASLSAQFYWDDTYQVDGMVFKINSLNWQEGPRTDEWRRTEIEQLIHNLLTPVVTTFSQAVDIRPRELWGQLAAGLEYGKTVGLSLAGDDEEAERIERDFQWLMKDADPALFASRKNALDFPHRLVESLSEPGVMKRMKPTCCLYYQTEQAKRKCVTCPRLTAADKAKIKEEIAIG
ncbi:(2Fe-2S)-binding protein [Alkalihalobacillus oceani]|uniref:(2Fe-2S)-binding protein n=1 Tax=Halalkalibacter oceani TaxID=1653776 RepID=A0A9X2DNN0_9BACI|nr:(2Fe-2S)-binding protein [Halalkalibacter oceani]